MIDEFANYHFQFGDVRAIALSDGHQVQPAESVVREVPPDEWRAALAERGLPTDVTTVYFNCLYLECGEGTPKRILVDGGWGQDTPVRRGELLARLQAEGIGPESIDLIVITHFDIDHIGGLTTADGTPVFPKAGYVISQAAWDFWTNEGIVSKWPPFLTAWGRKVFPVIAPRTRAVASGEEFLPGFQLILAPGHRPGHSVLAVASCGEQFLHLADTVGHPVLMEHPGWQWYADTPTPQVEADHRAILDRAVSTGALAFGSHLPFPGVGHVVRAGAGWRWVPAAR
jgi:glyoxylase-like metal-dependent hydrolase (beta-lactamase superfamily II)